MSIRYLTKVFRPVGLYSILIILHSSISAASIQVCSSCPLKLVADAVARAGPGDTIIISSGEYFLENIEITMPLTIIGMGEPEIISSQGNEIFTVTSDSVSIRGLHLKGVKTSYLHESSAIRMKKVKYFEIDSNRFTNNFFAVYLEHSSHGTVSGNQITSDATEEVSSGNAIHAWYCKHLEILDNFVAGHRDGIYFEFVSKSTIKGNRSENNLRYGLHFMFSNDDDYSGNQFSNNDAGVAVMFSKNITMTNNVFDHNWGSNAYGLLLKEIYDAKIMHNIFMKNTIGILAENSTRIDYMYNEFSRNGWAVKIAGGCLDNHFRNNNFINNSFDFSVFSSFSSSSINENYWSSYTGYDIDRNGIGDVPHRPMKLFSYITQQSDESIILIRSLFINLLNLAEKAYPVFTPVDLADNQPLMYPHND